MTKRLYVGNLAWGTTDESLRTFFASAGTVTFAQVIINKFNGRSKGFGFVEMASDADAAAAIDMWNGKDFEGRNLTVSEARPMTDRPPRRDM